jgi:tetratricopeptide (TPR) repeat protein
LQLFVQVCAAVQHAHQKGIIHRDLKPSNILVAPYDDKPVPKVIDFGLAKAMHQSLTDRTLHTAHETVLGTPLYMSPEQAQLNNLDVDTRSDIYSLGVLLYELLTGTTPLEKQRFKEAAWDEVRRLIREEEPPRPSARLSTIDTLPSLAACRQTEPANLTKQVRGELDWIVMKSLEKDRTRRYETANGFAMDVQRYLAGEAVLAVPPSAGYRLRKFARRNKRALATAALVGVMLLAAIGAVAGSIGWTVRDRAARRAKVTAELEVMLNEVKQFQSDQKWPEALAAARRAEALLAGSGGDAALEQQIQQVLTDLKLVQRLETIRLAQSGHRDAMERLRWADRTYADAFRDAGVDFGQLTEEEIVQQFRARPNLAPAVIVPLIEWAAWRGLSGDHQGARAVKTVAQRIDTDPWRHQIYAAFEKIESHGPEVKNFVIDMTHLPPAALEGVKALEALVASPDLTRQPPMTLYLLGMILSQGLRKPEIGVQLLRKAQMQYPGDFWINYGLGLVLRGLGPAHQDEALDFYRAAVALRPDNSWSWFQIGDILQQTRKKLDEAVACYKKAIDLDPHFAAPHFNLGGVYRDQKKLDDAVASYRKAIELQPNHVGAHFQLGLLLRQQRKPDAALDCFRQVIALNPKHSWAHGHLGSILGIKGNGEAAIMFIRKALGLNPKLPWFHAELAWYLATAADPKLRDPKGAVIHARTALELQTDHPDRWRNLGVALLRAGDAKAAVEALEKVDESATGQVHHHRFFLAMAYWQVGDKDKARQAYEQGMHWMDKNQPNDEEQRRLRAEAAQMLGIPMQK